MTTKKDNQDNYFSQTTFKTLVDVYDWALEINKTANDWPRTLLMIKHEKTAKRMLLAHAVLEIAKREADKPSHSSGCECGNCRVSSFTAQNILTEAYERIKE